MSPRTVSPAQSVCRALLLVVADFVCLRGKRQSLLPHLLPISFRIVFFDVFGFSFSPLSFPIWLSDRVRTAFSPPLRRFRYGG